MSAVRVAAVIPHWNRRELLEKLFRSLRAQTRPFDEIIVADNGSSDGSVEWARNAGARVVELKRNLGFAAAVNRGIEACAADWLAILNNDVTLAPDWLARLLDGRGDVWFASGKILRADDPSILDGAFDAISRGACACRCGAGRPDSAFWNQPRRIRFAPMTAALFRRRLFEEIGGLDESFESYLEDVDFGLRCALEGREGVYVPGAVAYHRGSSTLGRWNPDTVRLISRNQVFLAAKHFRGQPVWPILAGQLLWGLVALRHGRAVPFLKGKFAGVRMAGTRKRAGTPAKVRAIIEASEKEIFELERQGGFSWYWRVYFWLLRR